MRIKDLTPNTKNPRTITDAKLAMLKNALLEFGDISGVVFNRKSKQLVGGHQRTVWLDPESEVTITKKYLKPTKTGTVAEGYIELNGERFAYREVSWDKHREMAANLAANKGAGEWDMPELTEWMKELTSFDADDFDMSLTMFDEDEFEEFGGIIVSEHTRTGATGVDEDDVPEKPAARTRPGYIYQLGDHRLMCGDSTDLEQVGKLMNGAKVDMVFTDPPYGIKHSGRGIPGRDPKGRPTKANDFGEILGDADTCAAHAGVKMALKNWANSTLIFWGANYYCSAFPDGFGWIVWDKEKEGNIFSGAELAFANRGVRLDVFRHQWHGLIKASENGKKNLHPTQKPIALAEWCFENYGEPKTVLDLFGGSGSTLIACEKTARKCFMMEIDTHYCDVIVERFEKYTGQKAVLLNPNKMPKVTKLRKQRMEVNADAR